MNLKPLAMMIAGTAFASLALAAPGGQAAGAEAWYMKTIVIAEDDSGLVFDDRSGVFGRIPGGQVKRDAHDVPVFSNVSGSGGAIVFVKSEADWGEDAGQYLSDYKPAGSDKQTWTFTVTSSKPGAQVTLFWEAFHVITPDGNGGWETAVDNLDATLADLSLVDLQTGERMPASNKKGKMKSFTFNMGGASERHFRWVQGKVTKDDKVLADAPVLDSFGASGRSRMTASSSATDSGKTKDERGLDQQPPDIRKE